METTSSRSDEWLEGTFRQHHQAVLAYARRRVPQGEAEDVLAEVFAAAWRNRERVPDDALPWLYRAASNHVLHAQRGAARRGRLASRLLGFANEPANAVTDGGPQGDRVRGVLDRLRPTDAEILRLDAWEQLSADELSYVLGCSAAAARVRLHRARRRFAVAFDAEPARAGAGQRDCEARP